MFITVDVGGTNIRVAGADNLDDPVLVGRSTRHVSGDSYDADVAFIIDAAQQIGRDTIQAVGISVVGELNDQRTVVIDAENIPYWNDRQFISDISDALNCPTIADNDAVAAALAEAYYDVKQSDFAYIVWGTGIGGATVAPDKDGKPTASKFGWTTYFKDWEYECGGKKLSAIYGKPPEELTDMEWQKIISQFTVRTREFVDKTHPKALVFGGGLSVRHRTGLEKLSDVLQIPVSVTNFGGDSGLYGGLALIKRSSA